MPGWMIPAAPVSPSRETSRLELCLFGAIDVRIGGCPLPHLRSRKGLWLLALLALRAGRDVDRGWLAETLWPDGEPERARRSLRQSLHDLRAALGDHSACLACDSPRTLRLDLDPHTVDVLAFDAALARGDTASLEVATALYRGPLLEGCAEEWVVGEREAREQAYLGALAALAGQASARRDPLAAADYLRRAVATDPYREDLQRALMEALHAAGNPSGALEVYREFRTLLWRQMVAEPGPETTRLFHRLRDELRGRARSAPAASPAPAPPGLAVRPPPLPAPLTPLIGRDALVHAVGVRLDSSRLVTLTGTGGIGKTRLALQVAHALADDFEGGVGWVPLAPLANGEHVPQAIRAALSLPAEDPREDPLHSLQSRVGSRRLLLVLDNCEHLLEPCARIVRALLDRCAGLRILTTSRQPLGLPGEAVYRVPALPLPSHGLDEGLPIPSAAVELFVERARAAEASFALTPRNAAAVVQVCRRLDGIPLAIELAAARVGSLPVELIARRLDADFGLLVGGPALPPRHRTLAGAFDWSWDLLSPGEQALLRRLSVFSGGWTLDSVEVVCGDDAPGGEAIVTRGQVLTLLLGLVEKSLVLFHPGGDDGPSDNTGPRYHLLEPVRAGAAARLRESPERERIFDRHCDAFLHWAEAVKPKLWGPEQSHWFRCLQAEHDNLRAALAWCRAREDVEKELRLAVALCRFWDTHGHLREGRDHLNAALARAGDGLPYALHADARVHAGWMAYMAGEWAEAHAHYGRVLDAARPRGDCERVAKVLNYRALVLVEEEDYPTAQAVFEESLREYRAQGKPGVAVLSNLGSLALRQADYATACTYLQQSAAGCERLGATQEYGLALLDLSVATLHLERIEEARRHGGAALRLLYDCGAVVNLPAALDQMARVACAETRWADAALLFGAAERWREAAGLPPGANISSLRGETAGVARSALGADAFTAAYAAGKVLELHQAVARALRDA